MRNLMMVKNVWKVLWIISPEVVEAHGCRCFKEIPKCNFLYQNNVCNVLITATCLLKKMVHWCTKLSARNLLTRVGGTQTKKRCRESQVILNQLILNCSLTVHGLSQYVLGLRKMWIQFKVKSAYYLTIQGMLICNYIRIFVSSANRKCLDFLLWLNSVHKCWQQVVSSCQEPSLMHQSRWSPAHTIYIKTHWRESERSSTQKELKLPFCDATQKVVFMFLRVKSILCLELENPIFVFCAAALQLKECSAHLS